MDLCRLGFSVQGFGFGEIFRSIHMTQASFRSVIYVPACLDM